MKKYLWFVALLLLCIGEVFASSVPTKSERAFVVDMGCKEEHVCVLSEAVKRAWTDRAQDLQSRTGVQAVLLVAHGTGDVSFEVYANEAANNMQVGVKDRGGVIMLLDSKNQKSRLEVSRSLEGAITDQAAKQIVVKFGEELAASKSSKSSEYLLAPLMTVFGSIDSLAIVENASKLSKSFVLEKDKSFAYFILSCLLAVFISSILAVVWWSETWSYAKGSILGGVLCLALDIFFHSYTLSSAATVFAIGFVVTFLLAWIWHRVGDSFGWDTIDVSSGSGASVSGSTGHMASGVSDFAGGGATESLGASFASAADSSSFDLSGCVPDLGDCDVGGFDGCDIGGCDF